MIEYVKELGVKAQLQFLGNGKDFRYVEVPLLLKWTTDAGIARPRSKQLRGSRARWSTRMSKLASGKRKSRRRWQTLLLRCPRQSQFPRFDYIINQED